MNNRINLSKTNIMKLCIFIFTLSTFSIFAQEITKLQEYLPPSPEAQEFIKYGEYPVGMYTGVPNISIPLYQIDLKDIQVPISLSYHASGVQVDQIASWAGLGWSLNTGGMISKIPRGIPDDESNGFLTYSVPELGALTYDHDFYEDAATGKRDTESDIYYYNFGGYSGKFFFDRNKNIRLIEEVPLNIEYVSNKFIITNENGTTYEFNDVESTQTITYSLGNPLGTDTDQNYVSSWHLSKITSKNKIDQVNFLYEVGSSFSNHQYAYSESTGNSIDTSTCPPSISTNVHEGGGSQIASQTQTTQNPKRLKEITYPNGKVVFTRVSDRLDVSPDRLKEIVIYRKENTMYHKIKSYDLIQDYFYATQAVVYPTNPSEAQRNRLRLTELHELDKNGSNPKKHFFEYNTTMLPPIETNAKDFWGYYNGENSNINLIPLQPFQYFGNNVGAADRNPDSSFMKAGILNKITYPTGGYTEFLYEPHEYVTSESNLITKTKNAFAVGLQNIIGDGVYLEDTAVFTPNYSGYATVTIEASDRSGTSGVFPRITLQKTGSTNYMIDHSIDPTTYSYPLNPPEVNMSFPPVWLEAGATYTLKSVAEGTSSSTEFDGAAYMKADIDYMEEIISNTPVTKIAGGLRIQQIKSFTKSNEPAFSKRYEYKNETLITPETFIKEQYLDADIEVWNYCVALTGGSPSCHGASTTRRFYYGGTVQGLTLNGGSPVLYASVDELVVDANNNDLGKTNYTYAIQTDAVLPVSSSYNGGIMLLKKDWMGGQNTSKTTYAKNSADFIAQELKGHTIKKYDESYKMYKIIHSKRISGNCALEPTTDTYNRFDIIEYPIFRGAKLVNATQNTLKFESAEDLTTNSSIFYDNTDHLQPTRTESTNSKGESTKSQMFYADDVVDSSSLGLPNLTTAEKNAIDRLKQDDLHQIAVPVQTETTVLNGSTVLSKTTQRTNYQDWGNDIVLPDAVQTLKGGYSTANKMQDRITFYSYDSHGNPTELSKADGPVVSYIWGYNEQFPIAKIEHATYAQIAAALGISETALKSYNESNLGAVNGLRSSLTGAMVTTFEYEPLIGVTSMTDPRGYTINYHYDEFNRLKEVKDAAGNLVTDYQYNYRAQ